MVDMTAHLNTLNTSLQGKGGTALHMLEEVLGFERKLTVFAKDLQRGILYHFPALREFQQTGNAINSQYLQSLITAMQTSFGKRFCEFREEKNTLSFPVTPLTIDPSLLNMTETWNAIPDSYINMKRYAFGVLAIFGSTYICEQVFSNMNFIKNKHRSRLTDINLRSCLKMKVTSYSPDVKKLCSEVQEQKSH